MRHIGKLSAIYFSSKTPRQGWVEDSSQWRGLFSPILTHWPSVLAKGMLVYLLAGPLFGHKNKFKVTYNFSKSSCLSVLCRSCLWSWRFAKQNYYSRNEPFFVYLTWEPHQSWTWYLKGWKTLHSFKEIPNSILPPTYTPAQIPSRYHGVTSSRMRAHVGSNAGCGAHSAQEVAFSHGSSSRPI